MLKAIANLFFALFTGADKIFGALAAKLVFVLDVPVSLFARIHFDLPPGNTSPFAFLTNAFYFLPSSKS